MIRIKTLSVPLISALAAAISVPAQAQVELDLSSQKTYRQSRSGIAFKGGNFNVDLADGSAFYVGGCQYPYYVPPGPIFCPGGTTAFLTSGRLDGVQFAGPYFWISSITPAFIVEPRRPDLVFLRAAPASALPRPSRGFTDNSYSLYFNLHTTDVREYTITRYSKSTTYARNERNKFESEIVPGVYLYTFPRLGNVNLPAPISVQIFEIAEGKFTKNNKTSGFQFKKINQMKWTKQGFVEMSFIKPNVMDWSGLDPSVVFPAVDSLYLSMRVMNVPTNPNSTLDLVDNVVGAAQSIFPSFATGGDPRVLLANPFVSSFATPPIFAGGTRAVLELQLQRNFQTSGVAYDLSSRRFQIPVIVVNRYTDYTDVFFTSNKGTGILDDPDRDGYNNLNEWILDSNGSEAGSVPLEPVAEDVPAEFREDVPLNILPPLIRPQYFGFTVNKKLQTVPDVVYTLQRSTDNGKTWTKFVTDGDWTVNTVVIQPGTAPRPERDPKKIEIRVESNWYEGVDGPVLIPGGGGGLFFGNQVQPPGTENDRYRVKITLKKKK